jgi:predicted dehydrogenase
MKKLGIGMIGYGGVARVHAMAYRSLPYHYALPADTFQIIGVADINPTAAEKAAQELGCSVWTTDYRELLAREDIDVVDICVPNCEHFKILSAAAEAGKHIFCEKPLAMTVAEGQRIVAAAERAGVKTQINFNFRFFPAITRARQLIEAGFLGRVFSFRGCFYRSSYISPEKPLSWRLRKDVAGGGALFDLGSHVLDVLYFLLGDFESVQATVETLIKERPVAPGSQEKGPVDVDDLVLMQARMADGAPGTIEISRMGTGATNDLRVEIFGDKGAIRFNSEDPSFLEVFDTRDPEKPLGGMSGFRKIQTVGRYEGVKAPDWSMAPGFVSTFVESQYRFLRAVSEDLPTSPTLANGLHIQEIMEAALQSSLAGRWVKLAEVR